MAPRAIWSLVAKTASSSGWVCKRSSIAPTALSLSKSAATSPTRSEEHTSELQSHRDLHSFPTRRSSHLVVGREDGIQFRVGLQEVLHRTHCLEPVEVRSDLTDYLDVGVLNGLPHSGLPLVAGNRAGDARYEADASFAVHLPL